LRPRADERARQLRVSSELDAEAREIALAQRHGTATSDTAGRVCHSDKALAAGALEQLERGAEAPFACTLSDPDLVDDRSRAEGCSRRRHTSTVTGRSLRSVTIS
jgi:hypothetical protein